MNAITQATDGGGKRRGDRSSTLLRALVEMDGFPAIDARARNLSPGGLMVESDQCHGIGVPAKVTLRGIGTIPATVIWCREGKIGIGFDQPIDPALTRKPDVKSVPGDKLFRPLASVAPTRRPGLKLG